MKYRVSYKVEKSGYIDFEAENRTELQYELDRIDDPADDYDFYEESSDTEVELIQRLVPEFVVIVYDSGWETLQRGNIELRAYHSADFWSWSPEIDPGYMKHIFIESCFCILPGGDV